MSTHLGPIIANIFVVFYEQDLISLINGLNYYVRYVDDIFCAFDNKAGIFYQVLEALRPACTLQAKRKIIVSFGCSDAQIGLRISHIGVPETILHGVLYQLGFLFVQGSKNST